MSEVYIVPNKDPDVSSKTYQEVLDMNPDFHPALRPHLDRLVHDEAVTLLVETPRETEQTDSHNEGAKSDSLEKPAIEWRMPAEPGKRITGEAEAKRIEEA